MLSQGSFDNFSAKVVKDLWVKVNIEGIKRYQRPSRLEIDVLSSMTLRESELLALTRYRRVVESHMQAALILILD